jgi:hypothetical protein
MARLVRAWGDGLLLLLGHLFNEQMVLVSRLCTRTVLCGSSSGVRKVTIWKGCGERGRVHWCSAESAPAGAEDAPVRKKGTGAKEIAPVRRASHALTYLRHTLSNANCCRFLAGFVHFCAAASCSVSVRGDIGALRSPLTQLVEPVLTQFKIRNDIRDFIRAPCRVIARDPNPPSIRITSRTAGHMSKPLQQMQPAWSFIFDGGSSRNRSVAAIQSRHATSGPSQAAHRRLRFLQLLAMLADTFSTLFQQRYDERQAREVRLTSRQARTYMHPMWYRIRSIP